ncbi:MAG: SH3 domain-containing protein [Aureispira sp.]|nr:SH3 domain-containing protein [Aureispira sp.]
MKSIISIVITMLFLSNLQAQNYVLDESYKDVDFLKFKLELVGVILNKDKDKLLTMLDENITVVNFQDPKDDAKKMFEETFFSKKGKDQESLFWSEALKNIAFGFAIQKTSKASLEWLLDAGYKKVFTAPSFVAAGFGYSGGFYDDIGDFLVLGTDVNVRKEPSVKSEIVDKVSYEVVTFNRNVGDFPPITSDSPKDSKWYPVVLKNGKEGYIISDYISEDYALSFRIAQTPKGWKIIEFYYPRSGD